jgi:hypothetical protein
MKKVLLALALIGFSSPVYSQATFPVTNKRIVTDLWCDFLATKLEANAKYWFRDLEKDIEIKKLFEERDKVQTRLANSSIIYRNLCMK